MLNHGNLVRELQWPATLMLQPNKLRSHTANPNQTPILQSMQFKGSLGHGSGQPGRGRLSMGAGAEWVMRHSLNLRPRGGKSFKKGGSPQNFLFFTFCLFMITGEINHHETPGVWLGDWRWEERDGPRQPWKIYFSSAPR